MTFEYFIDLLFFLILNTGRMTLPVARHSYDSHQRCNLNVKHNFLQVPVLTIYIHNRYICHICNLERVPGDSVNKYLYRFSVGASYKDALSCWHVSKRILTLSPSSSPWLYIGFAENSWEGSVGNE